MSPSQDLNIKDIRFGLSFVSARPNSATAMSKTGTVKKFFEDKGFGFIVPDDGGDDVFIHVKDLVNAEGLEQGDQVTFDTEYDDRKGKYKASNCSSTGGGGGGGGGYGKSKGGSGGKGGERYSPYGGKGGKW